MNVQSALQPIIIKTSWKKTFKTAIVALIGLYAQGSLAQTTTILNFDTLADGAVLTNQYAGLTASGVIVANGASTLDIPAKSGVNVAYAPTGLMIFDIALPDIKSVSAYISGPINVGIFAYSGTTLVGQGITSSSGTNMLITATSSGPAITRIEIHNGGAEFAIDDLSFTAPPVAPPVPVCRAAAESAYNLIAALPLSAYVRSKTAAQDRQRLLIEVVAFEKLRAQGKVSQKLLSAALSLIQLDVKYSVKSSSNAAILQKLVEINNLIKANACQ